MLLSMASVDSATSDATTPITLKSQFLEMLNATATMDLNPRRQLAPRKRTTAQFINKHHQYSHPHEIPGFRVSFFENTHPNSFVDWLDLRPGDDGCVCGDKSHYHENRRIEKEKKKHFRLDFPPFPKPGPGPYYFRPIQADELAPLSPEFDDNYEVHVWESPNSKRILERKARCEASLKALAEQHPDGWKIGPGIPEDRAVLSTSPEPMVFARNPYALLNSEDDMSSGSEDVEEVEKEEEEEDEEHAVVDQDELYEVDDEDRSFFVLRKTPSPFFEESDFSLLRDDDGNDETVYPPSSLDSLFEAIVPLLRNQSSKFDVFEKFFGEEDGFGDAEEDEKEEPLFRDISSGASIHIALEF